MSTQATHDALMREMHHLQVIELPAKDETDPKHTGKDLLETIKWLHEHQDGKSISSRDSLRHLRTQVTMDNQTEAAMDVLAPQMSLEQAKRQWEALNQLNKTVDAYDAGHPSTGKGVLDTVAWLKAHQEQKKSPKSMGFIASVLQFLHLKEPEAAPASPEEAEDSIVEKNNVAVLPDSWGQVKMSVDWKGVGFRLLNAPFYVDMMHARKIILSGEITYAPAIDVNSFHEWLLGLLVQLFLLQELKAALLREKEEQAGVRIKLTTQSERVEVLFDEAKSLKESQAPMPLYGEKVLEWLNELEATLRDEELALSQANGSVMTPSMEYAALSAFFRHVKTTEPAGVLIAKMVAWMKQGLREDEVAACMRLFEPPVVDCILGKWMQSYGLHVHLLEHFLVEPHSTVIYSRSRVNIEPRENNPTA
jgi:hypothetical protein